MLILRRFLIPSVLVAALSATLTLAATATAAEIKIGEGTAAEEPAVPGERDLLKGSAEYDPATGTATFNMTTRQAPESTPLGEREPIAYTAALIATDVTCTREALIAASEKAVAEEEAPPFSAVYEFLAPNRPIEKPLSENVPLAQAYSVFGGAEVAEGNYDFEDFVPASMAVNGSTLTLSGSNPKALNAPLNCALVEAGGEAGIPDVIIFPLTVKPPPPAPSNPAPPATPEAKPSPPAAKLSIAKAKPSKLVPGKWRTVKVTVKNTGGAAAGPGSLRVKAPKGVVVKPVRQKLPALLPGGSWTVSVRVKATGRAKPKSTLTWTATAGGQTATGSVVLRLQAPRKR